MVCIGIYGDKTDGFTKQLLKRYFDAGISAAACTYGDCDRAYIVASAMGKDVFITNRCLWTDIKFDICVFFSWHENNNISIKKNGYAVINADSCKNVPLSPGVTKVTCGINSHAGVTVSAVSDNIDGEEKLQCCIQHKIRTMSGRIIEPQEFAVVVRGINYPLSEVLSLITTAIAGDIEETVTDSLSFLSI